MQVAPAELEAHILEHSDVVDAAVIAVDDDRNGELPKAFVVKRVGATVSDVDLIREIHERFEKHKSRYKWLSGGVEIRKAIPKSSNGKTLRRVLKDEEKAAHQLPQTSKI